MTWASLTTTRWNTLGKANKQETLEARQFLLNSPMVECSEALADYARPSFARDRSLKSCVSELTTRIFKEFLRPAVQHHRHASDRSAEAQKRCLPGLRPHLQVGCLHSMGIPAKYVSGYIETLPKPGEKKLVGADATHAWIAYFCPHEGWIEFDPTNDVLAHSDGQHIVTAFGRDYFDVTPVKGVIFGGGESPVLSVSVDVDQGGRNLVVIFQQVVRSRINVSTLASLFITGIGSSGVQTFRFIRAIGSGREGLFACFPMRATRYSHTKRPSRPNP